MSSFRDRLRNSRFYGSPCIETRETHVSWVFLTEHEAFKIKKPVSLGFLDFGTLAKREAACRAEVELNRRLAPDVYTGVVPVREVGAGLVLGAPESEGELVDWAVRMRRLDDRNRADVRLAAGTLSPEAVDAVAVKIADFHRSVPTRDAGSQSMVARLVEENFAQTRDTLGSYLSQDEATALLAWQRAFLAERAPLFAARARDGHVRDGHGDLRLEHVYLDDDAIRVLDCVEFDERYRACDVASDIAFLSMDLAYQERSDLAERFLATYARETGDYDLFDLVDFYESYRAFVRGKICAFLASDSSVLAETRAKADHDARRYFRLAVAASHPTALAPSVVAIGGLIASGKSTVASALAERLSAPIVCADRTRKQMLGVAALERVDAGKFAGAYDPAFTERVYAEVLRRADRVLASGRPAVVDASFRSRAMRHDAAALAKRHDVPFRFVECAAPIAHIRERLLARESTTGVSDARLELLDDFAARFEAVDELAAAEHTVVDTSQPLDMTLASLTDVLATWPAKLTG